MSNLTTLDTSAIEKALIHGNLGSLSPEERLNYFRSTCETLGLNPMTKPFEYITLNGKLTLYATRGCTDQLRRIHSVSIQITERKVVNEIFFVTVRATDPTGRYDEATGAVSILNLKGEGLANAMLKCETKAKRRVTLSFCGLGFLDETEIQDIPREAKAPPPPENPFKKAEPPPLDLAEPMPEDALQAFPSDTEDPENFGAYEIPISKKYKGLRLRDVPANELVEFVNWLKGDAEKKNKPLTGKSKEFVEYAEAWLAGIEV